jgi:tRNA(Ile)-lysidine synthase
MEAYKFKKKSWLIPSVEKTIRDRSLFDPGARLVIGVSGGPDSMALLSVLTALRPKWDLELLALYCHHGLRVEADGEEAFVRTWASTWGCRFLSRKLEVREYQREGGMSLEEAARILRHRAFEEVLRKEKADHIALAHTADDQAEEVLISLIRGAGLGGLAGIPMSRGRVIRPFLRTYKSEISRFLQDQDIPFQVDRSNVDQRFLRARVRHHLLPELKNYSPNILAQLNRTARLLQADEEFLQEKTRPLSEGLLSQGAYGISISRSALAVLPQALGSRLIQQALLKNSPRLRHIRSSHLLSILRAAQGGRDRGYLALPQGRLVLWDRNNIQIMNRGAEALETGDFSYEIDRPQSLIIRETGDKLGFKKITGFPGSEILSRDKNRVLVDFDKITWPLLIRNSRPGDRFQPLGLKGSKKISRFFIDRKIPLNRRPRIPLVFSNTEVVWVAGLEIGEPYRLDRHSGQCLEITYESRKEL